MKIFSVKKKIEMMVPEQCMSLFSTRPSLVKMSLSDILDNVPDPFPSSATVYLGDELYHNPTTAALVRNYGLGCRGMRGLRVFNQILAYC